MARNKGTFKFAANLEIQHAAALDPRVVVDNKSELINKETWPYEGDTLYLYEGLVVAVRNDKTIFMLVDKSKALSADYSGWKQLDVSAAVSIEVIDALTSQATNAALSANQGYILKQEIDNLGTKLSTVYSYKGTKPTYADLEAVEEPALGDVWNVEEAHENVPAGTNYAWNGEAWDALGGSVDLSKYYTKEEIEEKFVAKNENGDIPVEGALVVENEGGSSTTIATVEDGAVKVGDGSAALQMVGSEDRPSYTAGENSSELALLSDVSAGNTSTLNAAKGYTDEQIAALNVGNLVEKEGGKELIPSEKLELIDTNATDISGLRTDLDKLSETVEGLVDESANIKVDTLLTSVSTPNATATGVEIEFGKANGTDNTFEAGDAEKITIPAATTSAAGVMSAADKASLNNVVSAVTSLNSTSETLTQEVNKFNGDDSVSGSIRNIAKDEAAKAVADGMEWVEVVPEAE